MRSTKRLYYHNINNSNFEAAETEAIAASAAATTTNQLDTATFLYTESKRKTTVIKITNNEWYIICDFNLFSNNINVAVAHPNNGKTENERSHYILHEHDQFV